MEDDHSLSFEVTKKRTHELKKLMPDIPPRLLTQQLRELEADGIIIRKTYAQIPPKVEYSLSEYGTSLRKVLDLMDQWGEKHIEKCERNEK
jgi:DNA-binding HxlR family transcriptional regulator